MDAQAMEDESKLRTGNRQLKIKMACLAVTAALMTACCCGDCGASSTADASQSSKGGGNDGLQQKVLAFNLEGMSDNGQKKWDVTGKSAETLSKTQMKLNDIVAKSYGNESEATITAKDGIYDKTKNNITLTNDVKATIVSGNGLAGDMALIPQAATAGQAASSAGGKGKKTKTTIVCDGEVEFNYEKNQAYFSNNVKVSSDDGDIDADKITVNLDSNTRQIKEIIAEGNVKIKQGENITYSDKAIYSGSDRRIVLVGKPKLVIYQEGGLAPGLFGEKK